MLNKSIKGFTLIELLVVITIIGILATGAVTVYTSQIQKARDTTRITSVKALQGGIEQFYQDVSEYPAGQEWWLTGGQLSLSTTVNDYVPNLSEDPKHNQTCNGSRCAYAYSVGPDSNDITNGAYEISTAFENQWNIDTKAGDDVWEDPDRLELGLLKTGNGAADINTTIAQTQNIADTAAGASASDVVIKTWEVVALP